MKQENSVGQECEAPAGEEEVVVDDNLSKIAGVRDCLSSVNSLVPDPVSDEEPAHPVAQPVTVNKAESLDSLLPPEKSKGHSPYSDMYSGNFFSDDIPF